MLRKLVALLILLVLPLGILEAQTTDNAYKFTYQGYLELNGAPVNGTCDFQFRVYDALTGGNQIGVSQSISGVTVSEGVFSAQIDIYVPAIPGSIFNGQDRWLEIDVNDCANGLTYTTLSPRQTIMPSPYAMYAIRAGSVNSVSWYILLDMPPGFQDGTDNDTLYTAGSGLTLNGTEFSVSGVDWSALSNLPPSFVDNTDNDTTYTAGTGLTLTGTEFSVSNVDWGVLSNLPPSFADNTDNDTTYSAGTGLTLDTNTNTFSVPANTFWESDGNSGTTAGTNFIGTTDSVALDFRVGDARAFRLEPHTTSPNVIGGFNGNYVTSDAFGATIDGGGTTGNFNRVTDDYGTVGGGVNNQAGDNGGSTSDRPYATVAGGQNNTASGNQSTVSGGINNSASGGVSTVGGGSNNTASGSNNVIGGGIGNGTNGLYSTVGGGASNSATGNWSTVSGGRSNSASGPNSMVAGGGYNSATAAHSFAAGDHVTADDSGAFIWGSGDGSSSYMNSPGSNTFTVQASGGIWLGTNRSPVINAGDFITTSTGAHLTTGGTWANSSDRNAKANFESVDTRAVLDAVTNMPVTTWNYTAESTGVRHIGPMAQDFYTAFGLGGSETSITTIDADGVALAAIQGLNLKLQDEVAIRDAQILTLQGQLNLMLGVSLTALVMAMGTVVIVFKARK